MPRPALALTSIGALSLLLAGAALCRGGSVTGGQTRADAPAPPLTGGLTLTQTLSAEADGLAAVEVLLATYAAVPDGTLEVALGRPGQAPLAEWRLAAATIRDNTWQRFDLPSPLTGVEGQALTLVLRRPESGGRPLTAWTAGGEAYPAGELQVAGAPQGTDLAFRVHYRLGCAESARRAATDLGLAPGVALALLAGLFASPLAFLYTYARMRSPRGPAPASDDRPPPPRETS